MPLTETTKQKIKAVLDKLPPEDRGKALKLATLIRELRNRKMVEKNSASVQAPDGVQAGLAS